MSLYLKKWVYHLQSWDKTSLQNKDVLYNVTQTRFGVALVKKDIYLVQLLTCLSSQELTLRVYHMLGNVLGILKVSSHLMLTIFS